MAHLHSRDVNGVEERKHYFSKALEAYNKFFGRVPAEKLEQTQILVKNDMPLLEKRIALEDRRMQRLDQLGKTKKKPSYNKLWLAGATAAAIGIATLIGIPVVQSSQNRDQIQEHHEAYKRDSKKTDYDSARTSLDLADVLAKDLSADDPLRRTLLEDRVKLNLAESKDAIVQKKDYQLARERISSFTGVVSAPVTPAF